MDLYAHMLSRVGSFHDYVERHYGKVPRLRGIRLMKYEEPENCECGGEQDEMFAGHCGKDVVYIHTRCGAGNYEYFGADKWEESNPTFIEGRDDSFDCTYRDHYFEAVPGDDYDAICADLAKALEGEAVRGE